MLRAGPAAGAPAIASLLIFQFIWVWNDLLVALRLSATRRRSPSPSATNFDRSGGNIDIIAPASFMSLVVPLIVFFAFQRYFVQGLLAGWVK